MDIVKISLPKKLKEFADKQVADGKYADVSDYVRDVLRKDQDRLAIIAEIQAALDEGVAFVSASTGGVIHQAEE